MEERRGPVAPKDPTAKRPGYFIMKNKDVCGSPMSDGRGVQHIYESDGRLKASAKLVGNLENEDMIKELETVEGLRRQVHSIGVIVRRPGDPVTVRFAFQMYGKTDPYVTGTTLTMDLESDGMEMVMDLSRFEWSDDDNVPGQIRFEFPEAGMSAKVSVCFYLNDGYEAPEQVPDREVDLQSDAYKAMIARSPLQRGNLSRLKAAIAKARRGEEVTVGYIGGSITQGAGAIPINENCYAYQSFKGFCDLAGRGYEDNVRYIKAGVGGTPSELGMLRYERDVTEYGKYSPDVMIVEFAVNDADDPTNGQTYEGLIRRALYSENEPAVVLLFSVFRSKWNLQDRCKPLGIHYELPMVSIRDAVVPCLNSGKITNGMFFNDEYHPKLYGHTIMAECLTYLFEKAAEEDSKADTPRKDALKSSSFDNVHMITSKSTDVKVTAGGFSETDTAVGTTRYDNAKTFPDNFMHTAKSGSKPLSFTVKAKSILLTYKKSKSESFGTVDVYVDGKKVTSINGYDPGGWNNPYTAVILNTDTVSQHKVEVKMAQGSEGKDFTVMAFGYGD